MRPPTKTPDPLVPPIVNGEPIEIESRIQVISAFNDRHPIRIEIDDDTTIPETAADKWDILVELRLNGNVIDWGSRRQKSDTQRNHTERRSSVCWDFSVYLFAAAR